MVTEQAVDLLRGRPGSEVTVRMLRPGIDDPIDLALSDASHLQVHEDRGIPHMSARQAAVRAREAGVRRLILTHLVPGSDPDAHRAEAEAAYGGPVEVALPGLTFTI